MRGLCRHFFIAALAAFVLGCSADTDGSPEPAGEHPVLPEPPEPAHGGAKIGIRVSELAGAALTWRGIEPASRDATRLLVAGESLATNASILTDAETRCTVTFGSLAEVELGGQTMLHVLTFSPSTPRTAVVALSAGSVTGRIGELRGNDRVVLKTGDLAIIGTTGALEATRPGDGTVRVTVEQGTATILPWAVESLLQQAARSERPEDRSLGGQLMHDAGMTVAANEPLAVAVELASPFYRDLSVILSEASPDDGLAEEIAAARLLLPAIMDAMDNPGAEPAPLAVEGAPQPAPPVAAATPAEAAPIEPASPPVEPAPPPVEPAPPPIEPAPPPVEPAPPPVETQPEPEPAPAVTEDERTLDAIPASQFEPPPAPEPVPTEPPSEAAGPDDESVPDAAVEGTVVEPAGDPGVVADDEQTDVGSEPDPQGQTDGDIDGGTE